MNPNLSKISQQDFELIEAYFTNRLSEKEKAFVNERLTTDSEFKLYADEYNLFIQAVEEQVLKEKLNQYHNQVNTNSKKFVQNSNYYKIAIAAIMTILIGIGSLYFITRPNPHQQLFALYFEPDPGLPTTMGATTKFEFLDAMVDYKQGLYSQAIKKWKPLLKHNPGNDSINYFIAMAYLAKDNEQSAIEHLLPVINNTQSIFNKDANYYLGLTYLKLGKLELAKKYITFSQKKNSKNIIAEIEKLK